MLVVVMLAALVGGGLLGGLLRRRGGRRSGVRTAPSDRVDVNSGFRSMDGSQL